MAKKKEDKEELDLAGAKKKPAITTTTKPEDLAVDPTITNNEKVRAEKAEADALARKKEIDEEVAKRVAAMQGMQVNNKVIKDVVVNESEELINAVKKDAEERKKDFSFCPVTGVLVVA